MNFRAFAEKATSLFFIAVSVVYLVLASDYAPGARLIPMIVALSTLVVAVIQLAGPYVSALRTLAAEREVPEGGQPAEEIFSSYTQLKQSAIIVGWTLLLHFLIYTLGFVVAIPLFMAAFLGLMDRRSWIVTLAMTAALGFLTYLLIVGLLELPWNEGVIWSIAG